MCSLPPFLKAAQPKDNARIGFYWLTVFFSIPKRQGEDRESQYGKGEFKVYFAKSPGTLFFSSFIVYKTTLLCLCMSLCVQLHNSSISAMDKLVLKLPFWFTEHSEHQGKKTVKSKQELPLRISEQHFVYFIFYCPHSGEEESSSSSSSSSSLKEQGVSPRDAALLDCWLLGPSSCPVAKATSASKHNPGFSLAKQQKRWSLEGFSWSFKHFLFGLSFSFSWRNATNKEKLQCYSKHSY